MSAANAASDVDAPPVVTLLTDYGLADEFVGVCHGVILRICPSARIVDLTHGIPAHDVSVGAVVLARSLPYLPVGVHVAVVDPGVGGIRRAVALRTADGRLFVGPDNGLLWPATVAAGGIVEAADVSLSPWRLQPVSATFHGRDIFAPVAGELAAGRPFADAGEPIDPDDELVQLSLPAATIDEGTLHASVIAVDRFGNLELSAGHEDAEAVGLRLGRLVSIRLPGGRQLVARRVRTFPEAGRGELLVYEDASARLAIAVNHGSAAGHLGLRAGDELSLSPAEPPASTDV